LEATPPRFAKPIAGFYPSKKACHRGLSKASKPHGPMGENSASTNSSAERSLSPEQRKGWMEERVITNCSTPLLGEMRPFLLMHFEETEFCAPSTCGFFVE
jgi:hypothetical protein